MRLTLIGILSLLVAGCATAPPYWSRPGAHRTQLIDESEACYRTALGDEFPSALPGPGTGPRLLPRSEPPPEVWTLAPRRSGLARFDEQLRYERCMRERGWAAGRTAPLTR